MISTLKRFENFARGNGFLYTLPVFISAFNQARTVVRQNFVDTDAGSHLKKQRTRKRGILEKWNFASED
jgi:hypothetical protein